MLRSIVGGEGCVVRLLAGLGGEVMGLERLRKVNRTNGRKDCNRLSLSPKKQSCNGVGTRLVTQGDNIVTSFSFFDASQNADPPSSFCHQQPQHPLASISTLTP